MTTRGILNATLWFLITCPTIRRLPNNKVWQSVKKSPGTLSATARSQSAVGLIQDWQDCFWYIVPHSFNFSWNSSFLFCSWIAFTEWIFYHNCHILESISLSTIPSSCFRLLQLYKGQGQLICLAWIEQLSQSFLWQMITVSTSCDNSWRASLGPTHLVPSKLQFVSCDPMCCWLISDKDKVVILYLPRMWDCERQDNGGKGWCWLQSSVHQL